MKLRHLFFACSGVFVMMFSLLLLVVIVFSDEEDGGSGGNLIYGGVSVSQEVLAHKPMLEKYAREYGIEEYLNVLLAIIQVESGGTLEDVMQSSESLGLPPNSLSTEESIKQGCKYFSELLAAAETKGCDLNSVIQSYNYGGGFLDYVAGRGKKYTFELAESFARDKSGGKKVTYTNPIAVEKNGGWRYSYGNMFYVLLVSQYLTVAQFDDETVQAIMEEALKYVSDYEDEFVQMVMDTDMRQRNKELSQKKKRLTEIHSRIQELDKIFQRIYEDNISGKLSDERFMKLSKGYEEEQHTLQEEQTSLEKELQKEEKQSVDVKQFLSVVRKYTNLTELTPEIVHEFIDKIIVHAPDKSSGKRLQEIEIIYNHIGVFDHSKVTLWKGKAV